MACGPLGVAAHSDPSSSLLYVFFLLTPHSLRHKSTKKCLGGHEENTLSLTAATAATAAERPSQPKVPLPVGIAVNFGAWPGYLGGFFRMYSACENTSCARAMRRILAAPALKSLSWSRAGMPRKQFGGTPREKCVRLAG